MSVLAATGLPTIIAVVALVATGTALVIRRYGLRGREDFSEGVSDD